MSTNTNPNPACANSAPDPLDLDQFTGFTPGPWSPSFDDRHVESDEGAICEVYPQDLAGDDGEVSEEESRACEANNAALIAAAPALLAECKRQRAEIERLRAALQQIEDRLSAWEDGARHAAKAAERRNDLSAQSAHQHRVENYGALIEAARAALSATQDGQEAAQ